MVCDGNLSVMLYDTFHNLSVNIICNLNLIINVPDNDNYSLVVATKYNKEVWCKARRYSSYPTVTKIACDKKTRKTPMIEVNLLFVILLPGKASI